MSEDICKCEPELCSWWSPIPWKGNSELGLNMVLVGSVNMKTTQNLQGKIWMWYTWLNLLKTDIQTHTCLWLGWHLITNFIVYFSSSLFISASWGKRVVRGNVFQKMLFPVTLSSFINQKWLWEYMNIKAFYNVMIKSVIIIKIGKKRQ